MAVAQASLVLRRLNRIDLTAVIQLRHWTASCSSLPMLTSITHLKSTACPKSKFRFVKNASEGIEEIRFLKNKPTKRLWHLQDMYALSTEESQVPRDASEM